MSGEVPPSGQQVDVRDRRRKGWFSIDDEIIEVYGERIGVHGIAVYSALSKRADKNEQTRIGLSWFCKKLKIGREKLLKTLDLLEREGLISVEPGDRNHVSQYTLLHVEKGPRTGSDENHGGSNQNHPKPEAGSNQNHAGSDENHGGSNQNHPYIQYQTHLPNPSTKAEGEGASDEPLPDDTTTACLLLLKNVNGVGKDYGKLALLIAELRGEFPNADPIQACRDYEFKHRHGLKTKNHPNRLRQFFKAANSGVSSRASPSGGAANSSEAGNTSSGVSPAGKEARNGANRQSAGGYTDGYEFLFADE